MKTLIIPFLTTIVLLSFSSKNELMIYVPEGPCSFNDSFYGDTTFNVDAFLIDKSEVTVSQFAEFVKASGYITKAEKDGYSTISGGEQVEGVNWRCDRRGNIRPVEDYDLYPVTYVTWTDAVEYAKWAGKRLPTEIEWIHAFREADNAKFKFAGSNNLRRVSWHSDNAHVQGYNMVCSHKPNSLGIYDMSGNVAEMCSDQYDNTCKKRPEYVKVAKGGSFVDSREMMKYSGRMPCGDNHSFLLGFRCVSDIE